jgi:hypothetical protein
MAKVPMCIFLGRNIWASGKMGNLKGKSLTNIPSAANTTAPGLVTRKMEGVYYYNDGKAFRGWWVCGGSKKAGIYY